VHFYRFIKDSLIIAPSFTIMLIKTYVALPKESVMKRIALFAAALAVGLTMAVGNAEAARVGGGKSFGMQRQMAPVSKPAATAPSATAPAAAKAPGAATPATQPKRSWMGPLAGLAAGLGLAALASHFGFGEELANMMMFALIAFAVIAVVGYFLRKRAAGQQATMAGAGAPYNAPASMYQANDLGGSSSASQTSNIPANFDTEGFIRNAKVGFIRLQAAHDAGDLADIREFTSPEMFAEIRMDLDQRNGAPQKTDIVSLNAEILEVAEEAQRYVVSVRFTGMVREEANAAPVAIDEMWHLTKPVTGQGGWVLAGIQQIQ
jgi:predicted lipid-binding transport protein (Tim44 family)